MTGTDYETLAKLLHDAKRKRDAAEIARGVGDKRATADLRQQAYELEQKAEALDPQHLSEAWALES